MKKIICLITVLLMCMFMFVACDESYDEEMMLDEQAQTEEGMTDDTGMQGEIDTNEDGSVELGVAQDGTPFGSFSTTSVYGHEVTDDVFGEYAMTVVNFWATWCPPCIEEMDELEEVYQALPVNVNVLTICDDGATETDLAIQILTENGCNFDAIINNTEIYENYIKDNITGFPTTIFVDSQGNVFGEVLVGAPDDATSYYLSYAQEAMAMLQ